MGVGFSLPARPPILSKGVKCMKKLISFLSVVLVLVFSCVLTSFAESAPFVDVPSMTNPPWNYLGYYTVEHVMLNGESIQSICAKSKKHAQGCINVNPVGATRKYTFKFTVYCATTDNINMTGVTAKVYYEDIGSGESILLWQSQPSNRNWRENGRQFVDRTVVFPDSFQSSTGRLWYYIQNDSDKSTPCLAVYDLHITDMTTADLDNSLDKFGDRVDDIINPSVPYENFNDGSFKDSADELKEAENALPTVDFNAIDKLASSVDVSSYAQAFSGINQLFIRVVDTVGITPLIFFACFFGFCIFLIGRKLSGG